MKNLLIYLALMTLAASSCVTQRKIEKMQEGGLTAALSVSRSEADSPYELSTASMGSDTLIVKDLEGRDVYIMKAVRDSANGEMVATDVLQAAVVVARFRNVAERGGKVNIGFTVQVPQAMLDLRWQMRLRPAMHIMSDTVALEAVHITGGDYRRNQLKGYERYNRFLMSIVQDTTRFIDQRKLNLFVQRYIPRLYAFRCDSSYVSEEQFASVYGVTEREAVEHYTDKIARWVNNRRKLSKSKVYSKYVKVPICSDGLRIDSVLLDLPELFEYEYSETINTRPGLRKVEVTLEGDIRQDDKVIYRMPQCEPITFYISSLTSFVDNRPRYLDKVIERRAVENATYELLFPVNGTVLDPSVGNNAGVIDEITTRLKGLLSNEVFALDSIVVTAAASPEGSYRINNSLSARRSEGICRYFEKYMKHYCDSLERAFNNAVRAGLIVNLDDSLQGPLLLERDVPFASHHVAENWDLLTSLVQRDTLIAEADRAFFLECASDSDADRREVRLRSRPSLYGYIRGAHYAKCRNVLFSFNLHRREMVKDTIHTTVPDERYAEGVRLLKDHYYAEALDILAPYDDYNAALAYSMLNRNNSALRILERLDTTPEVDYLLAVIFSRQGRVDDAVKHYVAACAANQTYRHRGNLDPEIYPLIKAYGLNKEEEITF